MMYFFIKGEKYLMDDLFGEKNIEILLSVYDWIQLEFFLCKFEVLIYF